MVPPAGKGGGGEGGEEGRGEEEEGSRREERGGKGGGGEGEKGRGGGNEEGRRGRGGEKRRGGGRGGEEREAKERIKRANAAGNLKDRSGACVCIFQYVPFQGDLFSVHRLQEVDDFSIGLLQGYPGSPCSTESTLPGLQRSPHRTGHKIHQCFVCGCV